MKLKERGCIEKTKRRWESNVLSFRRAVKRRNEKVNGIKMSKSKHKKVLEVKANTDFLALSKCKE